MSDGWSATQVEASAGGGFEVFWSNSNGRTMAHKLSDTGVYESKIIRTIDQHETVFRADLDDDGFIGLNLVSIETKGFMSWQRVTTSIRSLIAMIVLSLALVIRIGVMVGVLLKLRWEVKAARLKYFGLILMVAR